jgi:hypothetical protein
LNWRPEFGRGSWHVCRCCEHKIASISGSPTVLRGSGSERLRGRTRARVVQTTLRNRISQHASAGRRRWASPKAAVFTSFTDDKKRSRPILGFSVETMDGPPASPT